MIYNDITFLIYNYDLSQDTLFNSCKFRMSRDIKVYYFNLTVLRTFLPALVRCNWHIALYKFKV